MGLRRRRRRIPFWLPLLALIGVGLIGGFTVLEVALRPTILVLARNQAEWTATEAIQQAVLEMVAGGVNYQDLVHIERDAQQRVIFMEANIMALNRLTAAATLAVQERLQELQNKRLGIPLGQVLGSDLLAAYGPDIQVEMMPTGVVRVRPEDSFEAAGINQTRHRIALDVESQVRIVVPFISSEVEVKTQVLLVEAVIVGEVPQTYLYLDVGRAGEGLISR